MTRFGHQDMFRYMGRDPAKRPLTPLERRLYEAALAEILEQEFASPQTSE